MSEEQGGGGHLHPPVAQEGMSFAVSATPEACQQHPALWGHNNIFLSFPVPLLSKLKTQVKEQGCQIEEKQSCSDTHQSARWVSESNLETEGSVWTQYIGI